METTRGFGSMYISGVCAVCSLGHRERVIIIGMPRAFPGASVQCLEITQSGTYRATRFASSNLLPSLTVSSFLCHPPVP